MAEPGNPYAGTPEWYMGQEAERHVREWLQTEGFFVLPATRIVDGGAPSLTSRGRRLTLPDYMAARTDIGSRWVEVKGKTSAYWYRKRWEWEHGIDEPKWRAYLEVERVTGIAGWLAVMQTAPRPALLMQSLEVLRRVVIAMTGSRAAYGGMELVYFAMDDFREVQFADGGMPQLPTIGGHRPWHDRVDFDNQQGLFE